MEGRNEQHGCAEGSDYALFTKLFPALHALGTRREPVRLARNELGIRTYDLTGFAVVFSCEL